MPDAVRIDVGLPGGSDEAISVCTNPDAATSHRTECRWFDQYTGIEVGADLYRSGIR